MIVLFTWLASVSIFPGHVTSVTEPIEPKKVEVTFEVSGVCGMCEERIEKALDVKGIVMADWNLDTRQLQVVFKPNQISENRIHELLNEAGHDTATSKATDAQYDGLHGCCKYREGGGGSCTQGKE